VKYFVSITFSCLEWEVYEKQAKTSKNKQKQAKTSKNKQKQAKTRAKQATNKQKQARCFT
jgi:hypothetical protein